MTFEKLEKNLMDVVLEEQAKLGFRREKIRLYYPLSTLNHLLGTQDTAEQMEVTLAGQPESMTIKLGKLAVSRKGDAGSVLFHLIAPLSTGADSPAASARIRVSTASSFGSCAPACLMTL